MTPRPTSAALLPPACAGALVRTGKYRAGQEQSLAPPPDLVADDLAAIVKILLKE